MYGTYDSAVRGPWWHFNKKHTRKVDLVAAYLKKINPKARIQTIPKNIVLQDTAIKLLDRDIIFLCTDDHWGRSIVNQIAYQYFIPTINLGIRIASDYGMISGGVGTIDILRPDMPCLWCTQFLRADRIAAESMSRSTRKSLEREGYVEGIDIHTPSVVSITTTLSGMAVTLFLQQVTELMGDSGDIARLNYNIMDGTVRRGKTNIMEGCICGKVRGFGDLKALPTLTDMSFLEE